MDEAMTRGEKIRKLGNAIRADRGATWAPVGAIKTDWKYTPQPAKQKRIRELLGLLRFDGEEQDYAIKEIDGFKSYPECDAWLVKLAEA